jgi:hypothetical protein
VQIDNYCQSAWGRTRQTKTNAILPGLRANGGGEGAVKPHYHRKSRKFIAAITINKTTYYLGSFKTKQEATEVCKNQAELMTRK